MQKKKSKKILISRGMLQEVIKSHLNLSSKKSKSVYLNEAGLGILDALIGFLEAQAADWEKQLRVDNSKLINNGEVPKDFSPKENPVHQLQSIGLTMQSTGYAVKNIADDERFMSLADSLAQKATLPDASDSDAVNQFIADVKLDFDAIYDASAQYSGWLRNARKYSAPVGAIGLEMDMKESATDQLNSLKDALQKLAALNLDVAAKKLIKSDAIQALKEPGADQFFDAEDLREWTDTIKEGISSYNRIESVLAVCNGIEILVTEIETALQDLGPVAEERADLEQDTNFAG